MFQFQINLAYKHNVKTSQVTESFLEDISTFTAVDATMKWKNEQQNNYTMILTF